MSFETPSFTGQVDARWAPEVDEDWLLPLLDPGQSERTLHWGRNYIFVAEPGSPWSGYPVVVKQFRHDTLKARLRRRLSGSKAAKSYRMAVELERIGVPTPEPLLLADSRELTRPSFFVSRCLEDALEVRYYLRAVNAGRQEDEYPELQLQEIIGLIADTARRLHDGGVWFRDFTAGNLLLIRPDKDGPPVIALVDLNRARAGLEVGRHRRLRDLARLAFHRRGDQRALLEAYWGKRPSPWTDLFYRFYFRGFHGRHVVKNRIRAALRGMMGLVRGRTTHPHIPPAPRNAGARDKAVWDPLSDQPHQHAGRWEKLRFRVADLPHHLQEIATVVASGPRIGRRYRELKKSLYQTPAVLDGMGVGLRPWPQDPDGLLKLIENLGLHRILLRLHPWQSNHHEEEELARELAARGLDLVFALPQNRDLVRDVPRWQGAVEELAERFSPFGRRFQVGQAFNRSKWGVWTLKEYLVLGSSAAEILRRFEGVEILGPAVIDFELHRLAGALNMAQPPLSFDIVSSLLYVDRRGAPEGRQLGLDTVDKTVLLKAIAETSPSCMGRCWITEVNWPLREGPHAPAGRSVAVTEARQADYLARYYLLALSTGLVERCYWWQLVAKGYGLVDPAGSGDLRQRPAFRALSALQDLLGDATRSEIPDHAPGGKGAIVLPFETPRAERILAAWSPSSEVEVELPARPVQCLAQDGSELPLPEGRSVRVGPSVKYFRLS